MTQRRRGILMWVILFLILGAIVNVAVAWVCLWFPTRQSSTARPITTGEFEWWKQHRYPQMANVPGEAEDVTMIGCDSLALTVDMWGIRTPTGMVSFMEHASRHWAGSPMRSVYGESFAMPRPQKGYDAIALYGLLAKNHTSLGMFPNRYQCLPLLPIWPGFALNTVFYAAVLWMLFALPFALRQIIRRRRGRCVRCGYDLRGQATSDDTIKQIICPECGGMDRPKA